jgi:hypothetical protein
MDIGGFALTTPGNCENQKPIGMNGFGIVLERFRISLHHMAVPTIRSLIIHSYYSDLGISQSDIRFAVDHYHSTTVSRVCPGRKS